MDINEAEMRSARQLVDALEGKGSWKRPDMSKKVSVVIPFYQKEPGILRKSVRSVLRQEGGIDFQIIVVDDESPINAFLELDSELRQFPDKIMIVEQRNGGPAAARNKGLDKISPDTEYVAFLDSDDEWIDRHLANALAALEQNYDFYFTDHFQLNQTVSAFKRANRIQAEQHPLIDQTLPLHRYMGNMFDQILKGNIIGTSTVVYRYRKFSFLRFREEFVYAGEDYLFWLELSRLTEKIAFSALCECIYGPGVNIFAGLGWGTEKSLIRTHYEMRYKKALKSLFPLTHEQKKGTNTAVTMLRKSFVADVINRITHQRSLDKKALLAQLKIDPLTYFYFVPLAFSIALGRTAHQERLTK